MAVGGPTLAELIDPRTREGTLWEPLAARRLRCVACGHRCVIPPGQRGVCKVRYNQDGRLRVPWGYVAGLQLDPIEKKPFFHAYPGARALSFGMLGCDLHCAYCFTGDTPIVTRTGVMPIAAIFDDATGRAVQPDAAARHLRDIQVVTTSGVLRSVVQAFRHRYAGELRVVKPMYLPPVRCTPGHRWFATTDPFGADVREVAAADLSPRHWLLVPKPVGSGGQVVLDVPELLAGVTASFSTRRRLAVADVDTIVAASARGETSRTIGARLGMDPSRVRHILSQVRRGTWIYSRVQSRLVEGDQVRFPQERRPGIPRSITLDKTLARLLGLYCAEGSAIRSGGRPNSWSVVFSFGHREDRARREVIGALRELFGANAVEIRRATTTAVSVGKSSLAHLLAILCGRGTGSKRVPPQIFESDASVQAAFLEAYVEGDGHVYPDGKLTATTASRELAYGVALLALLQGGLPALYRKSVPVEGRILGRRVRRHPEQWSVVWRRQRGAQQRLRETDKHFLVPIKAIDTEEFDGFVYNLEVEGEHSYLAGFCAVKNCQNALTSQALRDPAMGVPPEDVTPATIVAAARRRGARVLTSTYNEPLITAEWGVEVFRAGRAAGLVGSFVSNGNATPEVLDFLRPWVELYKVDLKAFRDRSYRQLGGLLQTILDSIQGIHARGFWLEIVTLVVPGLNLDEGELREAAQFIAGVSPDIPWHVTAFHPDYRMDDRDATPARALVRAAELGVAAGLRYVYAGNLPGRVGPFEDTRCPGCATAVVRRLGFQVLERRVASDGRCERCGTVVPGRWD
jgi:AmmeMemoRadiSam system radical SAM enzyme